ncbi:MAG: hypothetical protein ABI628_12050 [Chloroflexota bacterium]
MAISAVGDDAFEGRINRPDRMSFEQARHRNRMLQQSDHERYEADWPAVGWGSFEPAVPPRRRRPFGRR